MTRPHIGDEQQRGGGPVAHGGDERVDRLVVERGDQHGVLHHRHRVGRLGRHVTELGTRTAVSTTALLYGKPEKLVCYDKFLYPQVNKLRTMAGPTHLEFHQADVLQTDIEETDLLFIDTWHVYEQLREELRRHAGKARSTSSCTTRRRSANAGSPPRSEACGRPWRSSSRKVPSV